MTTNLKNKISVSLTDEAAAAVTELADKKGLKTSEVIRRAIALAKFIQDEEEKGSTFLLRNAAGELERVRFIFG